MNKPLNDLIKIIHFTEKVSLKIRGLLSEAEIYWMVKEEFTKSKWYSASITLLTDDRSKLRVAVTSVNPKKLKAGEKMTGFRLKGYRIDLKKSKIYHQVVRKGKTLQIKVDEIIGELFPQPLASVISKTMGYRKKKSILTPLRRQGEIIGVFAMTSTDLAEYLIPSVKNLVQHISNALNLVNKHAECIKTEKTLRIKNSAISSAISGIAINDLKGEYIYANQAFCKMVGYKSAKELLGKTPLEFVPKSYRGKTLKIMKAVQNKGNWSGEIPAKKKDGSKFYIQIHANLVKDEKGKPLCTMASFVDISQRKKAEKALRRAYEDLEGKTKKLAQLVESQKEFIAAVGHELRTPLSVIKTAVEVELDNHHSPLTKQLTLVNKKVDQITSTLHNLMLVSSLEIGQEQIRKTRFKLKNLLEEVLKETVKKIITKGINPKINLSCSERIRFYGDRIKISEVLTNLLENALLHSSGQPHISLKVKKKKDNLQILVEDNNSPIPQENLERIFEKFYKSQKKAPGLGLGLYICKKLVNFMGGQIWAESKKGVGNKFIVQLPISLQAKS